MGVSFFCNLPCFGARVENVQGLVFVWHGKLSFGWVFVHRPKPTDRSGNSKGGLVSHCPTLGVSTSVCRGSLLGAPISTSDID